MRLQPVLVAAMLGFAAPALAAVEIPACAFTCLLSDIITKSECRSVTNITCVCTNQRVTDQLASCILDKCHIRDALQAQAYSDEACGRPPPTTSIDGLVIPPFFGSLAVLFFGIRVLSRFAAGKRGWKLDDWVIVPPVIISIALNVISIYIGQAWSGMSMWYLHPERVTDLLYLFFIGEVMYLVIIPLTKISVLIFYLQIFPERIYKQATQLLILLNIISLISFVCGAIFQCTPISGAWRIWDGNFEASCTDLNKQVRASATVGIILDVAMLLLPMPALWKLKMTLRKKLHVMVMFGLGVFVTIVSIVRLNFIWQFSKTANATQDFIPIGLWSIIEACVGIICACLPAVRALLGTILPKLFGATAVSAAKSGGSTGGSTGASGSQIRVKSEVTVQSELQSRRTESPDDDDSSIELAMHESEMGLRIQSLEPIRPRARRDTRELELDIEAALDAAAAAYPSYRHDPADSVLMAKPLP